MESLLTINTLTSIIIIVVTMMIIVILVKIFCSTKTKITLGLLILSSFLLLENGIQVYSYLMMSASFDNVLMPFFLINVTELAGVLMFFKIIVQ